jgi:ubiquinone/menaquinone biosynthesis C-methylase UbiE
MLANLEHYHAINNRRYAKIIKDHYEEYRLENPEPFAIDLMEVGLFELGRYRFLNKRLRDVVTKNDVVLDIGCGLGFIELELNRLVDFDAKNRFQIIGIDIAISALRNAKHKMKEGKKKLGIRTIDNVNFVAGHASFLPIKPDSIDKIVCSAVLEHLPDDRYAVAQFLMALKPCGEILLFIPVKENFLPLSLEWVSQKAGIYRRPTDHFRHYDQEMISSILRNTHLLSVEHGGIFFSNYVSFLARILSLMYIRLVSMKSVEKFSRQLLKAMTNFWSKIYDIDELFTRTPRGLYAVAIAQKKFERSFLRQKREK